jgi:hypothetical protein
MQVTLNEHSIKVIEWYRKVWEVGSNAEAADNIIRICEGRLKALEKYNSSPKGQKAKERAAKRAAKPAKAKAKAKPAK